MLCRRCGWLRIRSERNVNFQSKSGKVAPAGVLNVQSTSCATQLEWLRVESDFQVESELELSVRVSRPCPSPPITIIDIVQRSHCGLLHILILPATIQIYWLLNIAHINSSRSWSSDRESALGLETRVVSET